MLWSRFEWGMLVVAVLGIWSALVVDFVPSTALVFFSALLAVPAALWAVHVRKPYQLRRPPLLGVTRRQVPDWIVFLVALPIAWMFLVYAGGMVLARAVSSEHQRTATVVKTEIRVRQGLRLYRDRHRCTEMVVRLQLDHRSQQLAYCEAYYGESAPPPGLSLTYRTHESPLGLFYEMTSHVQAQESSPSGR